MTISASPWTGVCSGGCRQRGRFFLRSRFLFPMGSFLGTFHSRSLLFFHSARRARFSKRRARETLRTECRSVVRRARGARIEVPRTWKVELGAASGVIQSHLLVEDWSSSRRELAKPLARARSKLPGECDGHGGKSMWPGAFRYPEGKSGWAP